MEMSETSKDDRLFLNTEIIRGSELVFLSSGNNFSYLSII